MGRTTLRLLLGMTLAVGLLAAPPIASEEAALVWRLRTKYDPMDRTSLILAVSSYALEGGGSLVIQGSCRSGVLSLQFSSFDSTDKSLPFDYSENGQINGRIKYDNEQPQHLYLRLGRFKNSVSIEIEGDVLRSLWDANSVMYDFPLSDGTHAFPLIHPHNEVLSTLLRPCVADAALKRKKQDEMEKKNNLCQKLNSCLDSCPKGNFLRYEDCSNPCWNQATSSWGASFSPEIMGHPDLLSHECKKLGFPNQ